MNRHLQEELDTDMPKYVKVMIGGTIIACHHGNIQIYISCALYGENGNTGEVGHVSVTNYWISKWSMTDGKFNSWNT